MPPKIIIDRSQISLYILIVLGRFDRATWHIFYYSSYPFFNKNYQFIFPFYCSIFFFYFQEKIFVSRRCCFCMPARFFGSSCPGPSGRGGSESRGGLRPQGGSPRGRTRRDRRIAAGPGRCSRSLVRPEGNGRPAREVPEGEASYGHEEVHEVRLLRQALSCGFH